MISRSLFRCAQQPLRQTFPSTRRYATNSPQGPAKNGPTQISTIVVGGGTVAAIFGAMYYFGAPDRKPTSSAPAPAKGSAISDAHPVSDTPAPKTFLGGDQGFIDLKLESVEQINHNVKKFRFALPTDDHVSGLSVASALLTKYKGPEMEKPVIRPYTPVSDEDAKGYLDFQIKKYPNGPMSEHMHAMEPNQRLSFKGPIPKYPWTENKHDHIALIAGGTGITPMYQLIRAIFSNPSDKTRVTLISANRTEDDILLKRELEDLENTYPQRFRAFYTVDKPSDGWQLGKGHVDKELLKTVLPEPKQENIKVFVCGPPGMYKAISGTKKSPSDQGDLDGILKELGYQKDQVYKF